MAEQYDFEVELAYDRSQFDGSQTITTTGGTIFNSGETDNDDLGLIGSWYFSGLSDDKGPRARAVFVDRASSVSVSYTRSEQNISTYLTSDDPAFTFPAIDAEFDSSGNSFSANIRYIDKSSGWFGQAGLLSADTTLSGFVSDSVDATGWSLGVGKYLYDTTALSLDFSEVDVDGGGSATVTAVSLTHLGNLGSSWQYAIDVAYSRADADFGTEIDTWAAALAFYPTRDFEFGIAYEDVSDNSSSFIDLSTTGIEGFVSWYVTPRFRLSARYRVDDTGYLGNVSVGGSPVVSDADQSAFGFSAAIRF
jgi:hypothetical protein